MTATAAILNQLNAVFAEFDAKHEANSVEWAKGRCDAIAKAKVEFADLRKNAWAYYGKLHDVAGGKTWYNVFQYGFTEQANEFVRKNAQATCEKRNATIAKKLEQAGIVEVQSSQIIRTNDGFDGVFKVLTNNGVKTVTVSTIYAGGYNIQCLHTRTLVKIK